MPKLTGFGKRARRMLSNAELPPDVRVARTQFKNAIKTGLPLDEFENDKGGLDPAPIGCTYYKFQVRQAHAGDPRRRGKRRLVALVDKCVRPPARAGRKVHAMYFSDAHYTLGQWWELPFE